MGNYILTHKITKEVISKHKSHSLSLAVYYFAAIKNISESDLLKIYDVLKTN
tara:strand:+ start:668 stop:823 length:156 start_codon:yes stop_codon:yes gene_type:complete